MLQTLCTRAFEGGHVIWLYVFLFGVEGFYNYIHAKVHKSEQFTKNNTPFLHSE